MVKKTQRTPRPARAAAPKQSVVSINPERLKWISLARLMQKREKNVIDLMEVLGLSKSSVYSLLYGLYAPSIEQVVALARYFNVPESELRRDAYFPEVFGPKQVAEAKKASAENAAQDVQ